MKYFILILACLCAMSCSRQTTGIDAFVSQYDQASVRMPSILMPLVKKKLHKAGINVKSIKVLTPEKLQNDSALLKRYLADLEMLDFKDYSKMVEVKEDDEHIRVFFKKDKEVIHQIVVVIRSTEGSEVDGILVLLKGEFNIKDIHKIIKHDTFR